MEAAFHARHAERGLGAPDQRGTEHQRVPLPATPVDLDDARRLREHELRSPVLSSRAKPARFAVAGCAVRKGRAALAVREEGPPVRGDGGELVVAKRLGSRPEPLSVSLPRADQLGEAPEARVNGSGLRHDPSLRAPAAEQPTQAHGSPAAAQLVQGHCPPVADQLAPRLRAPAADQLAQR